MYVNDITLRGESFLFAALKHRFLPDFSASFPRDGGCSGQVRVHGSDRPAHRATDQSGAKSSLGLLINLLLCFVRETPTLPTVKLHAAFQVTMLAWRVFFGRLPFVHFCALEVCCENTQFNVSAAVF